MSEQVNLFGEMQSFDIEKPVRGYFKQWRKAHGYQDASDCYQKCKNCAFRQRWEHHDKRYYKCALQGYSSGGASDIKLRMVCRMWKENVKEAGEIRKG